MVCWKRSAAGLFAAAGAAGIDFFFVQHTLRIVSAPDGETTWCVLTKDTASLESDARFRVHRGQLYVRRVYASSDSAYSSSFPLRRELRYVVALSGEYIDNGAFSPFCVPIRQCVALPVVTSKGCEEGSIVGADECVWQGSLSEVAVARLWPAPMTILVAADASPQDSEWWWAWVRPSFADDADVAATQRRVHPHRVSYFPPELQGH